MRIPTQCATGSSSVATAAAHADDIWLVDWERRFSEFERLTLDVPSIDVDTTDGYAPSIEQLVAFVNDGRRPSTAPAG